MYVLLRRMDVVGDTVIGSSVTISYSVVSSQRKE